MFLDGRLLTIAIAISNEIAARGGWPGSSTECSQSNWREPPQRADEQWLARDLTLVVEYPDAQRIADHERCSFAFIYLSAGMSSCHGEPTLD
jgi:hypothetical protein